MSKCLTVLVVLSLCLPRLALSVETAPAQEAISMKSVEAVMAAHPRLLFGPDDLPRLRAFAKSPQAQPFMKLLLDYLPSCNPPAENSAAWTKPPFLTDATDGQRRGYWQLPTVALHYVLTGDKRSLQRAAAFMQLLLELEHWETGDETDSGMSAANIMIGAALAYDWLYHDLDPNFREAFRKKLWRQAKAMYRGGHLKQNPGTHYWQNDPANNHRWHRDAGLALCVLAAYTGAAEERELLQQTVDELAYIAKWLPEDGTSHEGPTYAIFGNSHLLLAMQAGDRCLGTTHLQQPFFKNAGPFLTQSLTPDAKTLFPFGDSGGGSLSSYAFFLYKTAATHQQKDVYAILDAAVKRNPKEFVVTAWMPLIWYDPTLAAEATGDELAGVPTRSFFDDLGLVYLRDGWRTDSAAAMFKCGPFGGKTLNTFRNDNNFSYINVAHDDPDANSFILWKNGGFLAETDRYSKQKQSSHHNTILINGLGQMAAGRPEGGVWSQPAKGNVDMNRMAYITAYKEVGEVVMIEGEAAGSYLAINDRKTKIARPALDRFRRTLLWVEGKYVLVLDDIRSPSTVEVTWLMQGPGLVEVNAKAGIYRLERGKEACRFMVVADAALRGEIVAGDADHRGKPLGWKQLRLKADTKTVRVASVYELWNKGQDLRVTLRVDDGQRATVQVLGAGLDDTWQWQAARDANTASILQGQRAGKTFASFEP